MTQEGQESKKPAAGRSSLRRISTELENIIEKQERQIAQAKNLLAIIIDAIKEESDS